MQSSREYRMLSCVAALTAGLILLLSGCKTTKEYLYKDSYIHVTDTLYLSTTDTLREIVLDTVIINNDTVIYRSRNVYRDKIKYVDIYHKTDSINHINNENKQIVEQYKTPKIMKILAGIGVAALIVLMIFVAFKIVKLIKNK